MKALMYHYVRPGSSELPNLRYLHLDDFRRQLDYFDRHFSFVSQDDFFSSFETGVVPKGVVLTFDDGLKDHYSYVFPELKQRGLWGIFYAPGLPYTEKRLLDVHRIHILLGMFGGQKIYNILNAHLASHMVIPERISEFKKRTYRFHDDSDVVKEVKRTLNYYLEPSARETILDRLFLDFSLDEKKMVKDFYMTPSELHEIHTEGMVIGSHTLTHRVMSTLSRKEQEREINDSFDSLASILGDRPSTYCHPYGGDHSFNRDTEDILSSSGCKFAFSVEPRDVNTDDVLNRPYALPRYDCNRFPNGEAR